jgi:hypothetical protein
MSNPNSNRVQLGCGTLIIIALIVMFFSGRSDDEELKRNVQTLTKQVLVLQEKVDALSQAIEKHR